MKIAQIAPLIESVPPAAYGGIERIVSYLTEELVRQDHEVTLFASGDSETAAELISCAPQALRLMDVRKTMPFYHLQFEALRRRVHDFDIVHFHLDYRHFPMVRGLAWTTLTTPHNRLDRPEYEAMYREFAEVPMVSISDSQRAGHEANWIGTVHHGLPVDLYQFKGESEGEDYILFLGRLSPDKRPDRAIEIARQAGVKLKIAAKKDPAFPDYFACELEPAFGDPLIEYLGEVGEREKAALLAGARCLVFPIDWPEPFGLVTIEAMANGTPVVAWPHGAVPEILEEGLTGYLVTSVEAAVDAVHRAATLDRARIRQRFEERFSAVRMARDYLAIYRTLIDAGGAQVRARSEQTMESPRAPRRFLFRQNAAEAREGEAVS